VQIEA